MWFDFLLFFLVLGLGVIAAVYDIQKGIVPNKLIALGFACVIPLTLLYLLFIRPESWRDYFLNAVLYSVLLICLYITKCFAGGDLKLGCLFAFAYPAGCYVSYSNTQITLYFGLAASILLGYCFLLLRSVFDLSSGRTKPERDFYKRYLLGFFKSYAVAFVYVTTINLILSFIDKSWIMLPTWCPLVLCFITAWVSRRAVWMRNPFVLIPIIVVDIVLSLWLNVIPISLMPKTYLFTAFIIICQMTITTSLYQRIPTESVKAGMILSTATTIPMQVSRIRGLPAISHEDLRDRLTDAQASSVRT